MQTAHVQDFSRSVIATDQEKLKSLLSSWGITPESYGLYPDGAILHAYNGNPAIIEQLDGFSFKNFLPKAGQFFSTAGAVANVLTPLTAAGNVKAASNAEYLAAKKAADEAKQKQSSMYLYLGIGTVIALVILFLVLKPKK